MQFDQFESIWKNMLNIMFEQFHDFWIKIDLFVYFIFWLMNSIEFCHFNKI